MAKNKKGVPPIQEDKVESGGWSPQAPGVAMPFVIAEAGHEGARAAYELHNMTEGRIVPVDGAGQFRNYDDALTIGEV